MAKSAEKEPTPTALHSQDILASRQSASKTQRIIIGAVAVGFLIAVGLALYAFNQKNLAQRETEEAEHQRSVADANATEAKKQKKAAEDNAEEATHQKNAAIENATEANRQEGIATQNARDSRAQELVAYATGSLSGDPEKSILLAMQAINATIRFGQPRVPAAEDALHQAILSSQVRGTLRGHSDVVSGVAFSPDGKRLATASFDQSAKVYGERKGTADPPRPLRHCFRCGLQPQ